VTQTLVSGLQHKQSNSICKQLLALLAAEEEQKRKIIDILVREVRTKKISALY